MAPPLLAEGSASRWRDGDDLLGVDETADLEPQAALREEQLRHRARKYNAPRVMGAPDTILI